MKGKLLFVAILCIFYSRGTHLEGWDISYDHIPGTNQYVFTMQVNYLLIPPIGGAFDSIDLDTDAPVGLFYLNLERLNRFSPQGGNCDSSSGVAIYRSKPIDMGVIPATGYKVWYEFCCRANGLSSMTSNSDIYVETSLFPEPGQTYSSSSPRFLNSLAHTVVSGAVDIQQTAFDPDGDSLFYSLVECNGVNGLPITYYPGYSFDFPFGTNYPLTIDQKRDE